MLKTEYSSLLNLITIPGRSCVAESIVRVKASISACYGNTLLMRWFCRQVPQAHDGEKHRQHLRVAEVFFGNTGNHRADHRGNPGLQQESPIRTSGRQGSERAPEIQQRN